MDLKGIISITGRPGLFKIVAQAKNNLIVESLVDNKRIPAYATDRISALSDISIYTVDADIPLTEVYTTLAKKINCEPCISHKESANKLSSYLSEILPDYDSNRVYQSDIKKIFQWYNVLQKAGFITLENQKEEVSTSENQSKDEEE